MQGITVVGLQEALLRYHLFVTAAVFAAAVTNKWPTLHPFMKHGRSAASIGAVKPDVEYDMLKPLAAHAAGSGRLADKTKTYKRR